MADSYQRLKNWDKSAKLYMQFAKGNEKALNADVALHNAGVSFSNLKKPDNEQAIVAYELLGSKCPRSPHLPSAHMKLGIIHYQPRIIFPNNKYANLLLIFFGIVNLQKIVIQLYFFFFLSSKML